MNIYAIVSAQRKFIPLWKWLKATRSRFSRGASHFLKKCRISSRNRKAARKVQKKQPFSLQAKDRLAHSCLHSLQCNNTRGNNATQQRVMQNFRSLSLFSRLFLFLLCNNSRGEETSDISGQRDLDSRLFLSWVHASCFCAVTCAQKNAFQNV